jgi:hypothetical protein
MHTTIDTEVALWLVDNVPARMVWQGQRWRVIDTPTPIIGEPGWLPPMVTHPSGRLAGWRFVAKADDSAPSRVFDVYGSESGWRVRDVWD